MAVVAIVDWALALRIEDDRERVIDYTFFPKITGPKGGKKSMYNQMYHDGCLPPHYPVPAIRPYNSWGNDTSYITIWPGVMQQRISDEPYTGFGKVITFDLVTGECETRYDDFD